MKMKTSLINNKDTADCRPSVSKLWTAEGKWVYQAKDGPADSREDGKVCDDLSVFPAAADDAGNANDVSIQIRTAQYCARVTAS